MDKTNGINVKKCKKNNKFFKTRDNGDVKINFYPSIIKMSFLTMFCYNKANKYVVRMYILLKKY